MKKYFSYDNEPISGWTFWWRNIFACFGLILFIVPGVWMWAANGYKRAGTFNWSQEMKIISAFSVVISNIANLLSRNRSYISSDINLFDIIAIPFSILSFILLVKNGNKYLNQIEILTDDKASLDGTLVFSDKSEDYNMKNNNDKIQNQEVSLNEVISDNKTIVSATDWECEKCNIRVKIDFDFCWNCYAKKTQ